MMQKQARCLSLHARAACRAVSSTSGKPYVSNRVCPNSGVHILTLEHSSGLQPWGMSLAEHRFFPQFMVELEEQLDHSIASIRSGLPVKPSCIMLGNVGKYWSNGYDLRWMGTHPDEIEGCLRQSERLLAKVLVSPVPIVAVLGGHATALGMMMALACDFRVMGTRGLFSTPAVDLGLSLSPGLVGLVRSKLPPHLQRDVLVQGRKLRAEELLRERVISAMPDTRDAGELMKAGLEFVEGRVLKARALANPVQYEATKRSLYAGTYKSLMEGHGCDVEQYRQLAKSIIAVKPT